MTLHRLIGGKQLSAVVLIAVATLAIGACVPPKPPTTPTTTTTAAPGSTTTTTQATTTTTQATTTTTTAPSNPSLTLGGPSVALSVSASALNKVVDVTYTSAASVNKRTFLYVCFEDASSPTFNYLSSCSGWTEWTNNPIASATGTFINYSIFHGDEPTGDKSWGIYGAGETPSPGYTKYTTGYLRFTVDTPSNTTDQQFVPFTFSVS